MCMVHWNEEKNSASTVQNHWAKSIQCWPFVRVHKYYEPISVRYLSTTTRLLRAKRARITILLSIIRPQQQRNGSISAVCLSWLAYKCLTICIHDGCLNGTFNMSCTLENNQRFSAITSMPFSLFRFGKFACTQADFCIQILCFELVKTPTNYYLFTVKLIVWTAHACRHILIGVCCRISCLNSIWYGRVESTSIRQNSCIR